MDNEKIAKESVKLINQLKEHNASESMLILLLSVWGVYLSSNIHEKIGRKFSGFEEFLNNLNEVYTVCILLNTLNIDGGINNMKKNYFWSKRNKQKQRNANYDNIEKMIEVNNEPFTDYEMNEPDFMTILKHKKIFQINKNTSKYHK